MRVSEIRTSQFGRTCEDIRNWTRNLKVNTLNHRLNDVCIGLWMNPNIPNVINQKNLRIWKMSSRVNISNLSIYKKNKTHLGTSIARSTGIASFSWPTLWENRVFLIKWSDEGMIWSAKERWSVFRPPENIKPFLGNKALLTFIATDLFFSLSLSNLLVRYSGYSHYCLVLIITTHWIVSRYIVL